MRGADWCLKAVTVFRQFCYAAGRNSACILNNQDTLPNIGLARLAQAWNMDEMEVGVLISH